MLNPDFSPFPELRTDRLLLRKIDKSDLNEVLSLRSDKRIMQFIDRPLAQSNEDAMVLIQKIHDSLKNNDGITWGIALKENTTLIGTIGFWRIVKEHHRAEIGYLLHPDFQGKGIMNEAMNAALTYGFTEMKLHSIEANVNPRNEASIGLLEKNNFIQEAYFKENYYYNEKFLDSAIYSLVSPLK